MSYQADVLAKSPSIFLPLSDAVGSTEALDLVSGTKSLAKYVSGLTLESPSFMNGDLSDCASYPGSGSGRLEVLSGYGFAGTKAFTLIVWVEPTALSAGTDRRIFSKESPTTGTVTDGYSLLARSNKFFIQRTVAGVQHSQSTGVGMELSLPHMVVWTFDGERSRFYLDGSKLLDATHIGSLPSTESKLTLGSRSGGGVPFQGQMKDFAAWDGEALDDDEITALYQSGAGGRSPKATILGGKRRPQLPVGGLNVNNQVFRSNDAVLANIVVFEKDTTLSRIMLPFNCENTNFQPPTLPGRTDYGRGDGGRLKVDVCPVKKDGTPDLATVLATETFDVEDRYPETQALLGLSGTSLLNIQCLFVDPRHVGALVTVPGDTPIAIVIRCETPEPLVNWVSYNATTSTRALTANCPHREPCMDKDAPGALFGLDPRERLTWSHDGGLTWRYGPDVGGGRLNTPTDFLQYEFTGWDVKGTTEKSLSSWCRLPWLAWQEESSTALFHMSHPYQSYFQDGAFTLTCNGVPRSCVITHAGGLGNPYDDVGVITVKNLATGEEASTEHLGPGLQVGELDAPITLTSDAAQGDNFEISNDGIVSKYENDEFQKRLAGLGATREWPFATSGLQTNGKLSESTDFAQLFVLDRGGQWPFYAARPLGDGTYGDGAYGDGAYGEPVQQRIAVTHEYPPDKLAWRISPPQSAPSRWAADEPLAENIIDAIGFSDEMQGGDKEAKGVLSRNPRTPWPDLAPYSPVSIYGPGVEEAWGGRLGKAPESDGDHMAIEPAAEGYSTELEDDKAVLGLGFIDIEQGKWGEVSTQRRLLLEKALIFLWASTSSGFSSFDLEAAEAAIINDFGNVTAEAGKQEAGEADYKSGGVDIGEVLYDYKPLNSAPDPEFQSTMALGTSDTFTTAVVGTDHDSTQALQQSIAAPGPGYKFARLRDLYVGAYEGPMSNVISWQNLCVLALTGLTPQGAWPDIGFTAKQMLGYAIPKYTSLLVTDESLEDDGYVIPQAWFAEPTSMAAVVQELTKYGLLDWFVRGDRVFQMRFPGTYGRRWQAYAGPSELQEAGMDSARLWRSIVGQFQEVDGTTRTIGPPGSGADEEFASLEITDPDHPAVRAGLTRKDILQFKGISRPARALEACERWLEEANLLSRSGSCSLSGYVMDDKSVWRPVSQVRSGDYIRFPDAGDKSYRKITARSYDHPSRKAGLTLDGPPEGIQALLERFQAQLAYGGLG